MRRHADARGLLVDFGRSCWNLDLPDPRTEAEIFLIDDFPDWLEGRVVDGPFFDSAKSTDNSLLLHAD